MQEFVRCAAMEIESQGYFATRALSTDPRWNSHSIYVFGLDTYGNTLFSGDPYSRTYGVFSRASELNDDLDSPFGGRDVVSVGDAFGETFLYYSTINPATGMQQRKVAFVKRIVAYIWPAHPGRVRLLSGRGSVGRPGESGPYMEGPQRRGARHAGLGLLVQRETIARADRPRRVRSQLKQSLENPVHSKPWSSATTHQRWLH